MQNAKCRTWELQEEFDRDDRIRTEEGERQRRELHGRHTLEESELKKQIVGLMAKTTKYSKAVLEMYAVVKSLATQKR